jgi:hypothetical protein
MCETFLRKYDDVKCKSARKALQTLIEKSPDDKTEIIKCFNDVYPDLLASDEETDNEVSKRVNETGMLCY